MAHATNRMEIRLTPADKAVLTQAAEESSMPLSAFVRRAVLERAEAVLSLSRSYTPVSSLVFEQLTRELAQPPRISEPVQRAARGLADGQHRFGKVETLALDPTHHWRDLWRCPDPELTTWLREFESNTEPLQCRVWIPMSDGEVKGFYTLAPHQLVRAGTVATREQGHPAVFLRRLAIATKYGGLGGGGLLLADALTRVVSASGVDGSQHLVVEATTDMATSFWQHHGFTALPGTDRLSQRISDIAAALEVSAS